jgi:DedD protein
MDRQLLERMIGAAVLIVALVLIVPAILDGQRDDDPDAVSIADTATEVSSEIDEPTRTHTMLLDRQPDRPPVAREKTGQSVTDPEPSQSVVDVAPKVNPLPQAPKQGSTATAEKPDSTTEVTAKAPKAVTASAPPAKSTKVAIADTPKTQVPPAPSAGWAVQLGSFADKKNAERLANAVSQKGFEAYLMSLERSGKTLYRVRVGPRDSRAQAAELAARLAKAGYQGRVTQQDPES